MATEVKRLIRVRVEKGARFKRDGYGKKRQLSDSWRKPRGQHNKQREQKKAKGALPKPGFGSPVAVRGMHPSGFFEVLVSSVKELEGLDSKTQAVRISATVGDKKRVALQEAALAAGLKVLNARTVKAKAKKAPAKKEEAKGEGKQKKEEKKPAASKAKAPAKKEVKKEKPAPKAEEKKAPAKKAAAKPKAEEKAAPAKKPAAKPKAEKPAGAKPEKKAPAKKPAKSGVKKNE
ncbi:50S ribosomal protein L32e [Methanoregula formicica]|uniref:Large ribosomal subunit protein eL32 n=1 Tax=Methanoregula formicica (strain DSM 22288 / NBRC 105244 / SMSP) TaxID=593750 RepID=L0HHX2_METFS|nr:50S ribosomal protein L32e [Methanoregula formicica]AGB03630.1 ribosomal protein L32E [Methanoregula formicica SMSP]